MEWIAGYRIVRRLGSGSRANVYLGYAQEVPSAGNSGVPVAVKLFHSTVSVDSIDREALALTSATSPHLLQLRDVATLPGDAIAFVVQQLQGGSLARLLHSRQAPLTPGEAVTILAPIVQANAVLHGTGFAHGLLSSGRVFFDDTGAPVVTGLGHCIALDPLDPNALVPRDSQLRLVLAEELRRLGGIVTETLAAVDADRSDHGRREFMDWLAAAPELPRLGLALAELEQRIFALADPAPVNFEVGATPAIGGRRMVPARVGTGRRVGPQEDGVHTDGAPPRHAWLALFHLPNAFNTAIEKHLADRAIRGWVNRWRRRVPALKKPVWLAAGLATGVLVIALGAIPQGGPGAELGGSEPRESESESASAESESADSEAGAASAKEEPTASQPATDISAADVGMIAGDDPAQAATSLLRLRAECLDAASVLCLDEVDQHDSALMDGDRYRIRQMQAGAAAGPEIDFGHYSATLVERTGDAALVTLQPAESHENRQPVSALLMKGESGWRLRELFDY